MRQKVLFFLIALAVAVGPYCKVHSQDNGDKNSSAAREDSSPVAAESRSPDWDALRDSAESYVAAFNSGNAKAIADLYTQDAELVDAAGTSYLGRDVIAEEYAAFFEAHPDAKMQVVVENVTFVSSTVAIEDGRTETRPAKDLPPSFSRYVAVHVKEGDRWRLASVRDEELPANTADRLDELTWMIGRWVDEDPESLMTIDCYWHESGSYLMRDFEIKIEGLLASSGTERIGWDPLNKQMRSWLFDSDGGYLEGTWTRRGEQWTVTAAGFRGSDGQPIHSTYVVTHLRDDAFHINSVNRTAGREELEDFEMTVVRRPPAPGRIPALEDSADENSDLDEKKE